jgi:hypothetical protein
LEKTLDDIHLATEAEAWDLLSKLLDAETVVSEIPQITLGPWAKIDIYIPGTKYDSAITPYMMKGWVELQRSVYRSYSFVTGGKGNAATLSDREKDDLELIVEVKSGSSDQTVDVQSIVEKFVTSMVGKMEPQHILIAAVVLILTWGGRSAFEVWLTSKKEVKLAEIEVMKSKVAAEANLAALNTIAEVAGVAREHAALLARAAIQVPIVQGIEEQADVGREALIKHVSKDDAVVNGVPISAAAGKSVTSATRTESAEITLDGLYKIRKVDTTMATGFRVHLADATGKELVADVAEVMTTLEDRRVIQDAEWEKVAVYLQIKAKRRREVTTDAIILRARKYDPETDGEWRA